MEEIKKFMITHGVSLHDHGINNYAFLKDHALTLLELLSEKSIGVLGGDVVVSSEGQYRHTYDNWSTNRLLSELDGDYSDRSIADSKRFISTYQGKGTHFVLVVDKYF